MFIDFSHNKIIGETISEAFKRSFEERLIPRLGEHYPTLLGVQMYEDYISDKFLKDGYWYYPLTLVFDERKRTLWIKWRMSRTAFAGGNPYAYTGEAQLAFEIADVVPDEFREAISGRAIYCEEGLVPVRIDAKGQDPAFLSGKYSQTFVDEMARQLTREIATSQGVLSLAGSNIELKLVFAPDTYMEHTAESVTYRRLLIIDKGCAPRDFWVKWTRLDGAVGYTVSDSPAEGSISFEIGEDVPQKVREREYRFLMRTDPDKLHSAMSRKNVTEWREILRRAIRRGDLVKAEEDTILAAERDMELRRQLSEVLGVTPAPVAEPEAKAEEDGEDELIRLAREAIMGASRIEEPEEVTVVTPAPAKEKIAPAKEKIAPAEKSAPEQISLSLLDVIPADPPKENAPTDEERIRAEIEAKLRLEYESRARAAAEEEAARLRQENERLMEKARLEQEQKVREEARLKVEIEAKLRAEERERERLAEAARIAMQERKKLEEERAAEELRRKQEQERAADERKKREEQAKLDAERARIEAERAAEAERLRIERDKAEQLARELAEKNAPKYMSKTAEFTFRRTVDPNVTKRIYEIVKATIEFYHKEDVYIRIKASVPDTSTVRLEFLEVPEEEGELVVNIIKALGKSDLGIAKATLD